MHLTPARFIGQSTPVGELFRRDSLLAGSALFLLLLTLPTLAALLLETRTVLNENVWIKPLKFQFALAVYLGTLAWFAGWLPTGTTQKRWYKVYCYIVIFCIIAETVWVSGAALFAVQSHFNFSNAFMAIVYAMMGVFAVALTSATLVFGALIARNRQSTLQPAFKSAVVIGLVLTFLTTVVVAGYMSSQGTHFVGTGSVSTTAGFPLIGWARDGGDLRVAHFFATHAMHFIPLAGYLFSRLNNHLVSRSALIVFSAIYMSLVGYTFIHARNGQAFLAPIN